MLVGASRFLHYISSIFGFHQPIMDHLHLCMSRPLSLRLSPKVDARFSYFTLGIRNQHGQHSLSGIDDQKNGSLHRSMSFLGSYGKAVKNLRLDINQTSNQGKKGLHTSQPQNLTYPSEKVNQNHKNTSDDWHQTRKFSLIQPRSSTDILWNRRGESIDWDNNVERSCERLESGMVLLKNYISLDDQVEIVNICQEYGVGPGGFYQPCHSNGAKLQLQMMCFGRNWDPQTKYDARVRSDGSEAPPLPDKLISLSEIVLEDSRACLKSKNEIPPMYPDICIVNFYTRTGRLGLHQDRDESSYSLKRGLPVVSISIGDAAEFLYGYTRDVNEANKILLESGDVLIFGGKSRHVFHGVKKIIPDSAPLPLLKQIMLRPGRLNLTFRQF